MLHLKLPSIDADKRIILELYFLLDFPLQKIFFLAINTAINAELIQSI